MKNKTYRTLLLMIFSIYLFSEIRAQYNSDIIIPYNPICIGTNSYCNFDGFCSVMNTGNWGADQLFSSGAFSLQNPYWYSIIPSGNTIEISIKVTECVEQNSTVHWALYSDCDNLLNAILCDGNGVAEGGIIHIQYEEALPGHQYYIVLDETTGSSCKLEFDVLSGTGGANVGQIRDTSLNGELYVCSGVERLFSFQGFVNADSYVWSIDGVNLVVTNNSETLLTIPGLYVYFITTKNDQFSGKFIKS